MVCGSPTGAYFKFRRKWGRLIEGGGGGGWGGCLFNFSQIHRMQIWRAARLSPGTSRMKARLVSLMFCFGSTSSGKSCFVVDVMYFVLPSIKFFVFVNATRTE